MAPYYFPHAITFGVLHAILLVIQFVTAIICCYVIEQLWFLHYVHNALRHGPQEQPCQSVIGSKAVYTHLGG